MLTDKSCRAAKPKDAAYKLADSKGLYLYVTLTGFKSWRWKYRFDKKEKRLTFGPFPEVSLATARENRDEAARVLRSGLDPSTERKQRAATLAAVSDNTFEAVARRWHEKQRETWTPTHAGTILQSLADEAFPKLGQKPIGDITAPMVLQVVQAIEERGAVDTAHRVRGRMSAVFVFAIASGIAETDPAAAIQKALKPVRKGRQPALRTVAEARALMLAVETHPAYPITKLASRLLAITAVRPGVLRTATPGEFEGLDGREPIWRIPATRMKLLLEHRTDVAFEFIVPLPSQAVDVVRAALKLVRGGPLLFPSLRHAHHPMSENAISYMYARIPQFRGRHVPHGWRSTFSTVMNERADRQERPGDRAIIDLMLAHKPPGVEGIYNRAAYMPRRREIAQDWADMLLEGLMTPEEILKLPRK